MSEAEPLSLATFEPSRAYEPYLTTPRSLEACRRCGVQPIELVELSVDEFRREFPNDGDAAQRRFERVEGARIRLLDNVRSEWKSLVATNWKPQNMKKVKNSNREAILKVPDNVHCPLLEIQAAEFRKIENEEFKALQRLLYMELKSADTMAKLETILEKHEAIGNKNAEFAKYISQRRYEAQHERLVIQCKKDEEEAIKLKADQIKCSQEAYEKKLKVEDEMMAEKRHRENLEFERMRREQYTREQKEQILKQISDKSLSLKKAQDIKDKEIEDRISYNTSLKQQQLNIKGVILQEKINKTKAEMAIENEKRRLELLKRIEEDERAQRKLMESRAKKIEEKHESGPNHDAIQQRKRDIEKAKQDKTRAELDFKDELARRELAKINEMIGKRQTIKSIKQESFELAKLRRDKADEYKRSQILKSVDDKNKRSEAIRDGYITLQKMKTGMKDIMTKATTELKGEMHNLKHKGNFSDETIIHGVMRVTDNILFPILDKTFGIESQVSKHVNQGGIGSGTSTVGSRASTAPTNRGGASINGSLSASQTLGGDDEDFSLESQSIMSNSSIGKLFGGSSSVSPGSASRKSSHRALSPGSRVIPSGLPLKMLNRSNLLSSLNLGLEKVQISAELESRKSNKQRDSPNRASTAEGGSRSLTSSQSRGRGNSRAGGSRGGAGGGSISSGMSSRGGGGGYRKALDDDGSSIGDQSSLPEFTSEDGKMFFAFAENENESNAGSNKQQQNKNSSHNKKQHRVGGLDSQSVSSSSQKSSKRKPAVSSEKASFTPIKPGEFRRELSSDHPLAGGKGIYKKERHAGLKAASGARIDSNFDDIIEDDSNLDFRMQSLSDATKRDIELLKKNQNEYLLQVLDEERIAEEKRVQYLRQIKDDPIEESEAVRVELVFGEERQRASERIISITKQNEANIKQAVLKALRTR